MVNKDNKMQILMLSVVASVILNGCSSKEPVVETKNTKVVEINNTKPGLSLSVSEMSIRKLIKSVCDANSLSCDYSFQPSDSYTATFSYNGNLEGLLSVIKRQTGIEYKLIDGMVVVENKDDITRYDDPLKRSVCEKPITVSFKNIKLGDAFKYFYDEFGYSFVFDTRYTDVASTMPTQPSSGFSAQQPSIMPILASTDGKTGEQKRSSKTDNIAFFYNGCDQKEALKSFLNSIDMTMVETRDKEFRIRDYEVAIFDKSAYFNYSMTSGGSSAGGATGAAPAGGAGQANTGGAAPAGGAGQANTGGATSGASTSSTTTVSVTENHREALERVLQKYLSEKGKLNFSMRGYIMVEDKPSYVKRIQTIVKKEIEKEAPLAISINIVRVDLNDNYKAGVDWNAVFQNGLFGLRNLRVTSSLSNIASGGFSFAGEFKGADQVLSVLQDYGNTKIERSSTINARSGFLANYEAIRPVPYLTTASTMAGTTGATQLAVTPLYEQEGFIVNVLPNVDLDNKTVDLGIDVTVAEYVGDKVFSLGDNGTFTLPIVPKDKGKFAVQAKIGETIVLTGFKIKKDRNGKRGLPGLSQLPGAGALFGAQEQVDESSEILIILKVDQLKK
ncbi:MAG: type II and III secretion system protein [Epsilonproteobacteria bacterium]|nr:type II and III secretion system protein [Campylobacterota bacterium]